MKKELLFVVALASICLAACTKSAPKEEVVYSIDEVYTHADSLLGDTISFQGVCTHLCKHGGRKAFLMGSDESRILRVEGGKMGNFDVACISNIVRVKGVLHQFEIQAEPAVAENSGEEHGVDGKGCETEQKAIKGYYAEAISYEIVNVENTAE